MNLVPSHMQSEYWWDAGPAIRDYVNSNISGDPNIDWLDYTLSTHFHGALPITNCLAIGCGNGEIERRLAQQNAFVHCDGYESFGESELSEAIDLAEAGGYTSINYHRVSFNEFELSKDKYDFTYTSDVLQHILALEHVIHQIYLATKPEGLLVINGYIGPSRFQFPAIQKSISNSCLNLIPRRFRVESSKGGLREPQPSRPVKWYFRRVVDKLIDQSLVETLMRKLSYMRGSMMSQEMLKTTIKFPSRSDLISYDNSLAVRSEEIIPILQKEFEIIERREWGGSILQFLLDGIISNFPWDDQQAQAVLRMLCSIEDTLIKQGELLSDFAYIVAKPMKT